MRKYDRTFGVVLIVLAIGLWLFAVTRPAIDSPNHPNHPDYQKDK